MVKNVKQAAKQVEKTNFSRTQRQRVIKVLMTGEYSETASALICQICHKCPKQNSSLFKTIFIVLQHFLDLLPFHRRNEQ